MFPMWQQINVMTFIGFGFLKVFLKTNSWSAISFNFLCAAVACQWTVLCWGFWQMILVDTEFKPMAINIEVLIQGNYGAATGLITMAALVGKTTFPQIYLLVMLEMIFYTLNRIIITDVMMAVDAAGSMTIHMFGAYFGLTCAFFFKPRRAITDEYE